MKTVAFIGSDKNAGKTTAMNFALQTTLLNSGSDICLTSIGINGENTDAYEGTNKPQIIISKNFYFITTSRHLAKHSGKYKIIKFLTRPNFKNDFLLGQALIDFNLILEGPNEKSEILLIKSLIKEIIPKATLVIDGSIDRQFLAHPEICDKFYFALLVSDRKEQIKKAKNLISPLSFKLVDANTAEIITKNKNEKTKTILVNSEQNIVHIGTDIAFTDEELKKVLLNNIDSNTLLYLNGALTKSLFQFLAPFKKLTVALDNFTLFQNIDLFSDVQLNFFPKTELLNKVEVETIFIKQDSINNRITLPSGVHSLDIFKDILV